MIPRPTKGGLGVLLIVLFALALRLAPIEHGFPQTFVRDSESPHAAIVMLSQRELVPPLNETMHWPYLTTYLTVPAFGVQYVGGRILGKWSGIDEYKTWLLDHPEAELLVGRLLVALMGVATVWLAYRVARRLGLGQGSWVAAWLVATSLLHLHLSLQERTWIPMLFFSSLALWQSIEHQRTGRARPLLLACTAAGAAAATMMLREQGRMVLGMCGIAWILAPIGWRGRDLGRRLALAMAGILLFSAVELGTGRPYLLRYGDQPAMVLGEHVLRATGAFFLQADALFTGRAIPAVFRWPSFIALSRAFVGYEPVLVLLGLPGLWLALRSRRYWPGLVFLLLWGALFLGHRNAHAADSTPLVLFLCFPAALTAQWAWRRKRLRPLLALLLVLPAVTSLRYVAVMRRADTRHLAEAKLAELPPDLPIVVDAFGPSPLLNRAGLKRKRELQRMHGGGRPGQRDRRRLQALLENPGSVPPGLNVIELEMLVEVPYSRSPLAGLAGRTRRRSSREAFLHGEPATYRVWSADASEDLELPLPMYAVSESTRSLGDHPGAVFESLGARYLLIADFNPRVGTPNPLEELVQGREPLWVIDPGPGGAELFEARLPLELERPLPGLWQIERPGPRLSLYELPPRGEEGQPR